MKRRRKSSAVDCQSVISKVGLREEWKCQGKNEMVLPLTYHLRGGTTVFGMSNDSSSDSLVLAHSKSSNS